MSAPEREAWWARAKCLGANPDLFFPDGPGARPDQGIRCCNGDDGLPPCQAKQECFETGVRTRSSGVWGGVYFSTKDWENPKVIEVYGQIVDVKPRRV